MESKTGCDYKPNCQEQIKEDHWREIKNSLEENDHYVKLKDVLKEAVLAAECGKGSKRHADGQPFEEQPIMWIEKQFRSFQLGQAVKKIHESQRLDTDAAVHELIGAINFIAAHIIFLKKE